MLIKKEISIDIDVVVDRLADYAKRQEKPEIDKSDFKDYLIKRFEDIVDDDIIEDNLYNIGMDVIAGGAFEYGLFAHMVSQKKSTPKFKHDCDTCVFLGWYIVDKIGYDLYVCPKKNTNIISTVIARYSNDGPDYYSGLESTILFKAGVISKTGKILHEALKRAQEKGYSIEE